MTAIMSSGMDLLHKNKLVLPADLALLFRVLLRLQGLGQGVGTEVRVTELLAALRHPDAGRAFRPEDGSPGRSDGPLRSWDHFIAGLPRRTRRRSWKRSARGRSGSTSGSTTPTTPSTGSSTASSPPHR